MTLNSEEIKSVSQLVEYYVKFHINLVEGFMVDLKTFLGLAMPNQFCIDATKVNIKLILG